MTFLYLNSDKMGKGDDKLGKILLENFLDKLANSNIKIEFVGCVNSAINLTTEGSHVIDVLRKFEKNGAKISSCGTCLDYFKKREKLKIGKIGTMDGTIELMATADKIIQP